MHQVEAADQWYTQGSTARGMGLLRRSIPRISMRRGSEATLLQEATSTRRSETASKVQLIKCATIDE
jgi:hypothetical protein